MSGGSPLGFVLVLSRLILFINNLEDDLEANYIKSVEDTKAKGIVNANDYKFFKNLPSYLLMHFGSDGWNISTRTKTAEADSSTVFSLSQTNANSHNPLTLLSSVPPPPGTASSSFSSFIVMTPQLLPTNGPPPCQAKPTVALELHEDLPRLRPLPQRIQVLIPWASCQLMAHYQPPTPTPELCEQGREFLPLLPPSVCLFQHPNPIYPCA